MAMKIVIIVVLSISSAIYSNVLPVENCQLQDSTCLLSSFQKAVPVFMSGLPDYGVEVLDVMELEDVQFDLSGLQFSMKQGRLKGMKGAVVDSVKWNQKRKRMAVEFHVDCLIKGHYTAGGKILILPINGDGQITMKLKNVVVKYLLDYDIEVDGDGKTHYVPNKYSFDFEVKDNTHFTLTNLFNGNKDLSDTMHMFLNENWKQISAEFGRPIMNAAAKKIYENIVAFFKNVPIEDITIP
ncbi:hypothetical protein ACJJTC_018830 [Scirpophaga incertulas]